MQRVRFADRERYRPGARVCDWLLLDFTELLL
jgi:hypothetical protein